jgi:hypothetical protein
LCSGARPPVVDEKEEKVDEKEEKEKKRVHNSVLMHSIPCSSPSLLG